ncbi:MAG TPA: hypothetical protein VNF68_01000, partial [Candidatus Baltobacteraceae bacterium]|nr:hypothetical protein [Candidatus Baltobacteraceae bacterium]
IADLSTTLSARMDSLDTTLTGRLDRFQDNVAEQFALTEAKTSARFDRVDGRLDRVEGRLDGVEVRLDRVEHRLSRLDARVEDGFAAMDVRFERLERPRRR